MNRRKLLLMLVVAIPLALMLPLAIVRSRQPRELKLTARSTVTLGDKDLTSFFWRSNGLFLTRQTLPLQTGPLRFKNWDGQSLVVRAAQANEATLDAGGQTAALIHRRSARLEHDLWNVEAGKSQGIIARLPKTEKQQHDVWNAFHWIISPDGKRVAWDVPSANNVRLGKANTAKPDAIYRVGSSDSDVFARRVLAFSPGNRELAVVDNGTTDIIDANTGKKRRQWRFDGNIVFDAAQWSPDGTRIALWWGHPFLNIVGAPPPRRTAVFLRVFDAQTGKLLQSWSQFKSMQEPEGVTNISFAPDSKTLAFGTFDGDALLMDLASGAVEKHFKTPHAASLSDPAHYIAFAPDGRTLAVATQSKIMLWRTG